MPARAAAEVVALDHALEPASLADADDVHHLRWLELVYQNTVAHLEVAIACVQFELTRVLDSVGARLLGVTLHGLGQLLRLNTFDQTELNGVIAIRDRSLALNNHAGTRLEHGDRNHLPVRAEYLGHPQLFAENSWAHSLLLSKCLNFDVHAGR